MHVTSLGSFITSEMLYDEANKLNSDCLAELALEGLGIPATLVKARMLRALEPVSARGDFSTLVQCSSDLSNCPGRTRSFSESSIISGNDFGMHVGLI